MWTVGELEQGGCTASCTLINLFPNNFCQTLNIPQSELWERRRKILNLRTRIAEKGDKEDNKRPVDGVQLSGAII